MNSRDQAIRQWERERDKQEAERVAKIQAQQEAAEKKKQDDRLKALRERKAKQKEAKEAKLKLE